MPKIGLGDKILVCYGCYDMFGDVLSHVLPAGGHVAHVLREGGAGLRHVPGIVCMTSKHGGHLQLHLHGVLFPVSSLCFQADS